MVYQQKQTVQTIQQQPTGAHQSLDMNTALSLTPPSGSKADTKNVPKTQPGKLVTPATILTALQITKYLKQIYTTPKATLVSEINKHTLDSGTKKHIGPKTPLSPTILSPKTATTLPLPLNSLTTQLLNIATFNTPTSLTPSPLVA